MKLIKTAAIALIVSNSSAIQLNVQSESVVQIPGATLTLLKDNSGLIKARKQAANETVQDNGTLTQEGNSTFSHTLAEANSTIENHTTMIQLLDNASESHNATAHDNATFVQLSGAASKK